MGQYHYIVNLDKREFLDPYKLGSGLKLWEQLASHWPGVALIPLLACSNGRGGGDLAYADDEKPNGYAQKAKAVIGRWAGDRIAIVGDYAEHEDLAEEHSAEMIYDNCNGGDWRDITDLVCDILAHELGVAFTGDGWRSVTEAK